MKKLFLILLATIFTLLLIVSNTVGLMKNIAQYRYSTKSILGSDKYKYGDLFGMSYLLDFKTENDFLSSNVKLDNYKIKRCTNLYVAGDSYLGESFVKNESAFCGVKKYYYVNCFRDTKSVKLDKGEKNILLIETVERNLRTFIDTNFGIKALVMNKRTDKIEYVKHKITLGGVFLMIQKNFYNPMINQNLEFNLFDYKIFTLFKEVKANLNYWFFNRITDEVTISPDKEYLLLKSTVDTLSWNSSFIPISKEEIDNIVNSLNYVYYYYKSKGFDEVYFAIMPNPVTILYPELGRYNELIPRIQTHQSLKISIVNIYDIFRETKNQIYFKSDTHWNMNGFNIWLNVFNKKLMNNYKK